MVSKFPNGEHQIWVEVVNEGVPVDTDGDTIVDDVATFQRWANITLNFANDVFMQNYSPLYSAAGSITLQYSAATVQDYTFEVFKLDGDLLHSASGQSVNGAMNPQWDFTDLSGTAVTEPGYVFSLTFSPNSGGQGGAAAAKKIITTNFVDHGVDVGNYVISYGEWQSSSLNTALASLSHSLSVGVNSAAYYDEEIIGSGRDAYGVIHADFSSAPFVIRKATQTSDLTALTNALKDLTVGSWLFDGHSTPNNLIHGADGYLTVDLEAKEVASLLGNDYGFVPGIVFSVKYGRRLFSTMLTGCSTGSGASEFPDATGTPPGVQQVGNSQIKKSAYLGFAQLSYEGSAKFNWINRIHQVWLDGNDYDTPLRAAVDNANAAYPEVQNWGPTVLGYRLLEYNANDSL